MTQVGDGFNFRPFETSKNAADRMIMLDSKATLEKKEVKLEQNAASSRL